MLRAGLLALQFLTILPVPSRLLSASDYQQRQGQALLFYPLIGVVLGALVGLVHGMSAGIPSTLQGLLTLVTWVVLSGALHLDGLADSADAWMGGHGDRQRTLTILKDTAVGTGGVVALILVLLGKLLCLMELAGEDWWVLLNLVVLARTGVIGLFITTPYVRPEGIAAALPGQLRPIPAFAVILVVCVFTVLWHAADGLSLLIVAALGFVLLRWLMMRRLGGMTGDTIGAAIEIIEILLLLSWILSS